MFKYISIYMLSATVWKYQLLTLQAKMRISGEGIRTSVRRRMTHDEKNTVAMLIMNQNWHLSLLPLLSNSERTPTRPEEFSV